MKPKPLNPTPETKKHRNPKESQELPFDKNDDEISTDERFSKLRQVHRFRV